MDGIILLSPFDMSLAACLIVLLAVCSFVMKLGLEKRIVIAAVRTTVQLLLVGLVLKFIFASAEPLIIALIAFVMLSVAGREVLARQKRRFAGLWGYFLGTSAMFFSSFLVTIFALTTIIGIEPWYQPQYAIPILGMMLGNTMNGVSLGLDRLTSSAWEKRSIIEQQLMLGYTKEEAFCEIRKDSIRNATIPILNSMAAAGLVSLPGMMTGQILGGNPPMVAVKYQIMIMFMVSTGTGLGAIFAVVFASSRLFDHRHRLRLDRLKRIKS